MFLWLRNHFLENMFARINLKNIFVQKVIIVAKSFARKEIYNKNFRKIVLKTFRRKFLIVAISFPRKLDYKKKIGGKFLLNCIFFFCKIISLKTGVQEDFLKFLVEYFFMASKSFPRNQVYKKISSNIFLENTLDQNLFSGSKNISLNTGLQKN